ncbi:MAG TPA: hypothetical protein VEX38_09140, partial [Fimbriimonadaceae bacterium]|nr:hypothetical protein [Fimbriimonadaceae bacterium]
MLNRFSALIPATAIACAAHAQDDDLQKLRDELLNLDSETPITLDVPDIGMFGPIYATKRGVLLLSVNYQHQARYTTQRDGNISAVALFGDPYRSLAFQVNTVINDLDPLGSRGAVGFRVSKNIKGYTVSAGIQNAYIWGYTDSFRSLSLSVSKSF